MVSKMKFVSAAVLMSTLAIVSARAEEAAEASTVSATLDLPVLSAYVWRGQVLNDEAVLQPSLTVGKGGFAINWWGNLNLTDNVTGDEFEFSEHDIGISYSTVCEITGANLTAGVVNYDFPNQTFVTSEGNTSLYEDTVEAYIAAAFSDVLLAPALTVYYDFKEADGFYGSLAISHGLEISEEASLVLGASIGASDSDWGSFYYGDVDANFTDYSVSATLPYALNDSWTITPGIAYASLLNDAEDAVDASGAYFDTDEVIGSLKASYAF
jgi:hypothetical protein